MSVMVTGGAGYIGSVIVEQLCEQGRQVVVLDNLKYGHRAAIDSRATFVEGDIADANLITDTVKKHHVDAVIHMAAEADVKVSMSNPRLFFDVNVIKASTMLNALVDAGVNRMIFSSTAAVYGEPIEVPITESHPKSPCNAYGESKLQFEKILEWYHQAYDFKFVAVRYFNACGASALYGEDHSPEHHIIPLLLKTVTGAQKSFQVYGTDYETKDGTCVRDYVHVLDLADAHIRALDRIDSLGKAQFNLGSGTGNTVREVLAAAEKVTGKPVSFQDADRRPGDPAVLLASPEAAMRDLGWKPQHDDINDIIGSAWNWFQAHPNGYTEN
jgi:UDP-glucose 4-epimerase